MSTNIEVLRELDELVEAARLLGATQAKKLFGCYTDEDRRFERAMYESIDKHRAALLDWEAKQPAPEVQAEANYAHTVPDECETVHWRGQILSMNELAALAQQPAAVDWAIDKARFKGAPCYLCGYNGPGYYQPDTHPCAAKYHADQPAAEIDSLRTRLEDTVRDSTNKIEALRAEVEQLQRQLRQAHKDYGCELRDPNGTIWEYAATQRDRSERLAEALRLIESAKDRGFGIDYARGLAQSALRDHDQEVGNG